MPRPPLRRAASRRSRGRSRWSARSWAWVPMPTTRPPSSTMIWSACMIVPTRWATMITVASVRCSSSAALTRASVLKSRAEKLSSKTKMLAGLTSARAIARRWRWPPDTLRSALRDLGLQLVFHLFDEVTSLGDLERLPELLVGGRRRAVAKVAGDGPREQERLLRNDPDAAPEVLSIDLLDVHAIDQHLAAGRVVEARDQVDQRRFAAAGAADDRGRLARPRAERDPVQDRVFRTRVAELHVAKLDDSTLGLGQ